MKAAINSPSPATRLVMSSAGARAGNRATRDASRIRAGHDDVNVREICREPRERRLRNPQSRHEREHDREVVGRKNAKRPSRVKPAEGPLQRLPARLDCLNIAEKNARDEKAAEDEEQLDAEVADRDVRRQTPVRTKVPEEHQRNRERSNAVELRTVRKRLRRQ